MNEARLQNSANSSATSAGGALPRSDLWSALGRSLQAQAQTPPPVVVPRGRPLPLSIAQEGLWLAHLNDPGSNAYNVPLAWRLTGPLDVAALERSLGSLIERHEILRSRIALDAGLPAQVVGEAPAHPLHVVNFEEQPLAQRETAALQWMREEIRKPFDLAAGPLLRTSLLRLANTEHLLVIVLHHLVIDAWSLRVLLRDWSMAYRVFREGGVPSTTPAGFQSADYAAWQRKCWESGIWGEQRAFWKNQLTPTPTKLDLPADRPRPLQKSFDGDVHTVAIETGIVAALDSLRAQTGVSRHSLLLAVFEALLFRYSGQEDFLVGIPTALRRMPETHDLVGFLVNTQTWRARVAGDMTFRELAIRVHQTALDAYANQDVPFEKLVEDLRPERAARHMPLFQVMFVYHNVLLRGLQLPGLQVRALDCHNRTAKFDLMLQLQDTPEGLRGFWEFSTDLFQAETIARLSRHFLTLLRAAVTQPDARVGELPLLTLEEKARLLEEWNNTRAEIPPVCVHDLFAAQAARTPSAIAVVDANRRSLTYTELDQRANALAARLSVKPDECVGLCLERSLEMAVAVLAVLKAGAAYVPLDPAYPAERLRLMIEDARAALVLTSRELRSVFAELTTRCECIEDLAAAPDVKAPQGRANPESLAYIIFTSGSTGRPKGVAMPHHALVNLIEWHWRAGHPRGLKTLQFAPLSFDVSFQEMFTTWCSGGTLLLISDETRRDPRALLKRLSEHGIERLFLPFVALQQLAETAAAAERLPGTLREVITAGEQLQITASVATFFRRLPDCTLHNHYGPTESHVVTAFTLRGAPEQWPVLPPIGRPITNTRIYLLDARRQPVPVGVTGELFIAGDCLARGYLHRPELTAERFVPDPFSAVPGARLYRTGDAARWRADGEIEFLGRLDQQVKIRGFRVELGEIETLLSAQPGVKQCAVVLREDRPGDKRLVAYVAPALLPAADSAQWSRALKTQLPDYMIPSAFVTLDALPQTPSGKVDRRALPAPDETQTPAGRPFIAPRDAWERELVALWERTLGVHPISVDDDFFALGGHSLLAARLFAELEQELDLHVPLAMLFETPTVEQLAAAIRRRKLAAPWLTLVPIQPRGTRPPMFWVHTLGGGGGGGLLRYRTLASLLGPDQPSIGIEAPHEPFTDIPTMATQYLAAIRQHQSCGPYYLGGYCFGGVVACEMARQLEAQGETVGLLAVLDSATPAIARGEIPFRLCFLPTYAANVWFKMIAYLRGGPARLATQLRHRLKPGTPSRPRGLPSLALGDIIDMSQYPDGYRHYAEVHWKALIEFRPQPYNGKLLLFRARHQSLFNFEPTSGFSQIARGGVEVTTVPGVHETLLEPPTVLLLAKTLRACLEAAHARHAAAPRAG